METALLKAHGWMPHFNDIDAQIANAEECPVCHRTMRYCGLDNGHSYRAFCVCECGEEIEF